MNCLEVIISKRFMSRLGLVTDTEIDFTLNTVNRTAEKKLVFKKMKIEVRKIIIALPVIMVDGSHFDLLLGINWIKKTGAKFNFKKN